jgi:hypothetical protein
LTLEEGVALSKQEWEMEKILDKVYEEMKISYTAESAKYDEEVYKMSEYLNMYREDFLKEIESDGELEETYQILLELINK